MMNRLLQLSVSGLALIALLFATYAQAQTCPFDDGNSSLEVEGLILTRYALGLTGAPLVASTGINAVDAPTVEATINCPSCGLNITGNPTLTVADATIISRKLAGFTGAALTDNLALGSGTRNTPAAVQSFLLLGCGATGGTVTSITAGTGLTGGTITGSGTIAADTTFLQRRVATGCAVGSFISAIGADGTPTCATPPAGTVTNVTASAPLASSGGAAPTISLSGAIPAANGGTGLVATGAAGNVLRSTGTVWASAPLQAADVPSLSASYINNSATLQSPGTFNISGNGLIGGNVGIGTSNPQVPLEVITTAGTGNAFEVTTLGGAPAIYGRRANGTAAAPSNVQLGNTVAVFAARGYGTSAYGFFTGYMDFQATENWTNTAQGTRLRFFTPASGSNSPQQRMVIDQNGNVGIGATIPGSPLTVAGTIESTSGGVKFPDGTTQTTSAAGRQVWSSNNLLNNTLQGTGVVSGRATVVTNFTDLALPLPQSCTASNFSVAVLGATGSSAMTVYLTTSTPAQMLTFGGAGSATVSLSCSVTASTGSLISCTSAGSASLVTPLYLNLAFVTANGTDFNNTKAYVSFTCR